MDVLDDLHALRATTDRVTEETVAADLARGHRALIRQRRRRVAMSGVFAACAVTAVAVATLPGASHVPQRRVAVASRGSSDASPTIRLVSYTGVQPHGFDVQVVPEGWQVSNSSPYVLVITPSGVAAPAPVENGGTAQPVDAGGPAQPSVAPATGTPQPAVAPATGTPQPAVASFLSVSLPSPEEAHAGAPGDPVRPGPTSSRPVTVNGQPATIVRWPAWARYGAAPEARLTFVDKQGKTVEVGGSASFSDQQLVQFAEGITVTDQVQQAHG